MAEIFVIVTALNEAPRIEATLAGLAAAFPGAPVWVADDGSSDATSTLARASGAQVVRSERVIGKGAAATLAAGAALLGARSPADGRSQQSIFVLCDGDLGESAARLSALADAVAGGRAELAVGAFAVRAGGGLGVALGFARWAIRRRCGARTRAPISGQRALSGEALRGRAAVRARLRHGDGDDDRRGSRRASPRRDRARPEPPRQRADARRLCPSRAPAGGLHARLPGPALGSRRDDPRDRPGHDGDDLHRLRRARGAGRLRPPGGRLALPAAGLGAAGRARDLGGDARGLRAGAAGRRRARGRARGRRHHQPARDGLRVGPGERRAAARRDRLAGPSHGGAL